VWRDKRGHLGVAVKSHGVPKRELRLSGAKPRVMVVDDDPDVREVLVLLLGKAGFDAIEADSGAQCLKLLQTVRPAVILLDLMMPEMDGFEVCRALKQDPAAAEIPVIVLTARDDNGSRMRAARLGASDFLVKPVSSGHLISRVRAQLELLETIDRTRAAIEKLAPSVQIQRRETFQSRGKARANRRKRG